MNRTQYAAKNAFWGTAGKIISLLFAFLTRTAFIYILGNTYLGVNGLYSEILSLLSIAELGFGSAITYAMYKPVASGDTEKIVKLLAFFKTVYRMVAGVITVLGLCLLPFLGYIVKGADWLTAAELKVYFLIYLFNTVIGYFVSYRYTYLNANQENYIRTNIDTVVTNVSQIVQILAIFLTRNFLVYLLANSAVLLVSRFLIAVYLDKKYPILKRKPAVPLSKEEKAPIFHEVRGLVVHQFASVAVHSTDNILISTMTKQGIAAVGYISNYNMLMRAVLGFVTTLFNSFTSGFGNLAAVSTTDKFRKVFQEINFANFWVYGFCSIAFWILIPPFITLWIGADKVIDQTAFTLIIINCYLEGQCAAYHNTRIAKGNFNKDKVWALAQAVTNLVVSVICARLYGIVGIYIGTVVSRMVYVVFRPYSTYRFLFDESPAVYYKKLIQYFLYVVLAAGVTKYCVGFVLTEVTVARFAVSTMMVAVIPNLVFLVLTCKSAEAAMWKQRLAAFRWH